MSPTQILSLNRDSWKTLPSNAIVSVVVRSVYLNSDLQVYRFDQLVCGHGWVIKRWTDMFNFPFYFHSYIALRYDPYTHTCPQIRCYCNIVAPNIDGRVRLFFLPTFEGVQQNDLYGLYKMFWLIMKISESDEKIKNGAQDDRQLAIKNNQNIFICHQSRFTENTSVICQTLSGRWHNDHHAKYTRQDLPWA